MTPDDLYTYRATFSHDGTTVIVRVEGIDDEARITPAEPGHADVAEIDAAAHRLIREHRSASGATGDYRLDVDRD